MTSPLSAPTPGPAPKTPGGLGDPGSLTGPDQENPTVSVIVRTKNSYPEIVQALGALYSQDMDGFEVIVVDSGSTDRTLEFVRGTPARIIEIKPEDYFPGRVLNMAVAQCRGSIVVFQNSDVIPLSQKVLRRLLEPFRSPAVQAAFARQVPRPEAETWVRRDYAAAFPASGSAPDWLPYSLPLAAMRRSAWEVLPFYDSAWGSEDTEWGVRARERGMGVRYVPLAVVMHSHNYTLRQLFGRRFIEGEADAFIYGGRPSLIRAVRNTVSSFARDLKAHLSARDLAGILRAPLRRGVYHWAYFRGNSHGFGRRVSGNGNAEFGQRVVLSRYET